MDNNRSVSLSAMYLFIVYLGKIRVYYIADTDTEYRSQNVFRYIIQDTFFRILDTYLDICISDTTQHWLHRGSSCSLARTHAE